jgi:hypothetical protein
MRHNLMEEAQSMTFIILDGRHDRHMKQKKGEKKA